MTILVRKSMKLPYKLPFIPALSSSEYTIYVQSKYTRHVTVIDKKKPEIKTVMIR